MLASEGVMIVKLGGDDSAASGHDSKHLNCDGANGSLSLESKAHS